MQRQACDVDRFFPDADIEADSRGDQPRQMALRGTQTVITITQMKDRAIVDDLALIVAPDRVRYPAGANLAHIARHQAIDVVQRVRAR